MEDCGLAAGADTGDWSSWANETAGLSSAPASAGLGGPGHGTEGHQCSVECDHAAALAALDAADQQREDTGAEAPPGDPGTAPSTPGEGKPLPSPENAAAPGPDLAVGWVQGSAPPGFPDKFGLTKPGADTTPPKLTIRVQRRNPEDGAPDAFAATIEPTVAADAHDTAWATPAGWYDVGAIRWKDGLDYRQLLEVTPDDAANLEMAEGEHLGDIAYAFDLTLGAVAKAINANTREEFWGPTEKDARAHALAIVNRGLHPKLQAAYPETIGMQADIARSRLVQQNPRDDLGWHDAHVLPQEGADSVDFKKRTMKMRLDMRKDDIGQFPASAMFNL